MERKRSTAELDQRLSASKPFGDSDYIRDQFESNQERRLAALGTRYPAAAALLEALQKAAPDVRHSVLGDPALRSVIMKAGERPLPRSAEDALPDAHERVFQQAITHVAEGRRYGLLGAESPSGSRVGPDGHGWMWRESASQNPAERAFHDSVVADSGMPLRSPDSVDLDMVRRGAELLTVLLPKTSAGALRHAHVVAVISSVEQWRNVRSNSLFRLGGAVFLGTDALRNPWVVAEYLLHESLHQKLYEVRHAHSLLRRDFDPVSKGTGSSSQPSVVVPWRPPGTKRANEWDVFRALAAFHVYVHLAVLAGAAEIRARELEGDYGSLRDTRPAMTSSRTAAHRAHFLAAGIRRSCWDELGPAGRLMVGWLNAVLCEFDPSPPPPGSDFHLLMDRYLGEARRLEARSMSARSQSRLRPLMADEIRSARLILAATGERTAQDEFDQAVLNLQPGEDKRRFCRARELIAESLRILSPDGYVLRQVSSGSDDPGIALRNMIDGSSDKLAAVVLATNPQTG